MIVYEHDNLKYEGMNAFICIVCHPKKITAHTDYHATGQLCWEQLECGIILYYNCWQQLLYI